MEFNEYQAKAKETAIYPERYALLYPVVGLAGEAGEVANKVQKLMRDKGMVLDDADRKSVASELGDVVWYVSAIASDLGYDLEDIVQMNLEKLKSRMERGKIGGAGDNR
jgi:NTP pyrophosphatase (non-canonical NTP hydrolase)